MPIDDLERLLAEAPFVRALARQLVVDDPDEVVQQTWLCALEHGRQRIEQPRSWLARIVRNVAANVRRGNRRRELREREFAPTDLVPSSAELLEREERRRALVAAVDALPPALRTVVLLRWFEGLAPRRIAALLDVPVATVWTQLHRAIERLRAQLDAKHGGDRRAWLLPLVPFAAQPLGPAVPIGWGSPPAVPAVPVLVGGVIAMTTKTKVAVAAAMLAVAVGAWLWRQEAPPVAPPGAAPSAPPVIAAQGGALDAAPASAEPVVPAASVERTSAAAAGRAAATTGALVVHLRFGDDHAPAPDLPVNLGVLPRGGDPRFDGLRRRTDAAGDAQFEALGPGRYVVATLNGAGKRADIVAGETTELELELEVGLELHGIVVDLGHRPIAGALVEVTQMAMSDVFPDVVAVTGADGRFTSRACPTLCLVGARAAGYTASSVRFVLSKPGSRADVELVLGANGGEVAGAVVDVDGRAVAHAVVIVGAGKLSGIPGQDSIPPFPALVRADAEGRFRAVGLPAGPQPVHARAAGFAPWTGSVDVAAGGAAQLSIPLARGATVRGVVRDAQGLPVERAEVEIGDWDDVAHYRASSAADGSFVLAGVPNGEVEVRAKHGRHGKAVQRVQTGSDAGGEATCELQLSRGLVLVGRVLDPDGQPVSGATVECMHRSGWFAIAHSDPQGRFTAANFPEQGGASVTVNCGGFEENRQREVDANAGELVVHLVRAEARTVRVVGTVLDPDGRPAANVDVTAWLVGKRGVQGNAITDDHGRFEFGPVAQGPWQLVVRTRDYVEFETKSDLAADTTWDLGTITLARGGSGVVRVGGTVLPGANYRVVDTAGRHRSAVSDVGGELRTGALADGEYRLVVSGDGIAAQRVPFTIRTGSVTTIDVRLEPGMRQHFVIEGPAGVVLNEGASLRLYRGDEWVASAWGERRDGDLPVADVWLTAGDYRVTVTASGRSGEATFQVGASPGDDVRIAVR